jgi:hypothetical protein
MGQVEKELEAALKRLRRSDGPDGPGVCLSADVLAAWMDGTLPPAERAVAQAHAADCPRCLGVLAAMARTVPERRAQPSWWRAPWRVRWVVPALAGATAFVLWIYVGSTPPATEGPAPPAAERTSSSGPPSRGAQQESGADTQARPIELGAARSGQAMSPSEPTQYAKQQASPAPASGTPRVPAAPAAPASAPAENVPLRPTEERQAVVSEAPADVLGQGPPAAVARSEAESGRRDAVPQSRTALADSAALRSRTSVIDVVSPDPATRWRIGGTAVDQSTDGGATWTRQFVADVPLLAGHAPAASVCWVVGRQGAVLLTRDGRTWQRVASPEAIDLIAVNALDGRAATVTAADGRLYRTSDAGQTWSLQEKTPAPF